MLTVLSMFLPCTQWVFGPFSPVITTVGTSLIRIVRHPPLGILSKTYVNKEVQVEFQSRMEAMGYKRAMDVAVRMWSIQEMVGEVGSIAELLAAQMTSPTVFIPGQVEDISESEEGGKRFDEID